ncbi:MAG TPA: hypothetical protein VK508_18545 [Cyclobacteriaceae bacterium]|nr:hypothetical protein [Cyclobacteriaceae bacterium]
MEKKILELQKTCAVYEPQEFSTFIAGVILQIGTRNTNPFFKNLMSPMRQLFYLAYLNLQFNTGEGKVGFSEAEWNQMTALLHEIEMEYFYLLGYPKDGGETREEIQKISVTMPTFMNYYFNGPMAYEEQEIERIETMFKTFEDELVQDCQLRPSDFLDFYKRLNVIINQNLNTALKFLDPKKWQAFTKECIEKGITNPKDWINEAKEEIYGSANLMKNPGSFLIIDPSTLELTSFEQTKWTKIVPMFTFGAIPPSDLIYYTDDNRLMSQPFVSLAEGRFLPFCLKQFVHASYHFLFDKCSTLDQQRLLKSRDEYVERKAQEIFRKLFPRNAVFYTNYSIDEGQSEQDILILFKKVAIVIEVKASNYRAPMRDALKAFEKLKSDFKKCVQYGYEQAARVVKAFSDQRKVKIIDSKRRLLYELNSDGYQVFSVVVTYERYGQIQTNLADMLELDDDARYPWCVCLDDLEAFILTLAKRSDRVHAFLRFLKHREDFHGHLLCSDELELCGLFLEDSAHFVRLSQRQETVLTEPHLTRPIEESYRKGMGFKHERFLKEKRSGKIAFLYSSNEERQAKR